MKEVLLGKANFQRLGNDLFWNYYLHDETGSWVTLKWVGYSDGYWWTEVAPTRTSREVNGIKYRIDFSTSEVFVESLTNYQKILKKVQLHKVIEEEYEESLARIIFRNMVNNQILPKYLNTQFYTTYSMYSIKSLTSDQLSMLVKRINPRTLERYRDLNNISKGLRLKLEGKL